MTDRSKMTAAEVAKAINSGEISIGGSKVVVVDDRTLRVVEATPNPVTITIGPRHGRRALMFAPSPMDRAVSSFAPYPKIAFVDTEGRNVWPPLWHPRELSRMVDIEESITRELAAIRPERMTTRNAPPTFVVDSLSSVPRKVEPSKLDRRIPEHHTVALVRRLLKLRGLS